MSTGEDAPDRSGLIAALLALALGVTFLAAAQWLAANWAMLTTKPPPVEEKIITPIRKPGPRAAQRLGMPRERRLSISKTWNPALCSASPQDT